MSLRYDVWASIVNGYKAPNTPPTDMTEIRLSNNNSRARNAILSGLKKSIYTKFMYYASAKDMWDKLKIFMKEMRRLREKSYKSIKDNFRLSK
jgi:hypothetical protein